MSGEPKHPLALRTCLCGSSQSWVERLTRFLARYGPTVCLLLISVLPLWTAWQHNTHLNDDTYITLTYAKNLAAGHGFVYNHPPPTQGTTTPLFAVLVAVIGALLPSIDLSAVAVYLTALCWIGIGWTFYAFRGTWNITIPQVLVISLVVVSHGWIAFLGMESYVFAFLLVLTFSLWYSGQHLAAGVTAGLLFLTRGEGALVAVLLGVRLAVRAIRFAGNRPTIGRFLPLARLCLGFALPVSVWFGYAFVTFGSLLPNTLAAKRAQGHGMTFAFLRRLIAEWIPTWGMRFKLGGLSLAPFWWFLILVGFVTLVVKRRRWLIFVAWILLYVLGYTLLQVSPYWWYQLPIHFVAQILVSWGLVTILKLVHQITSDSSGVRRKIPLAFAVIATALVFLRPFVDVVLKYEGDSRAESYLALCSWIRENTQSTDSIGYVEVGYLGYYTPNRIIDLLGLVLPDVVPYVVAEDIQGAFWQYMPDYYLYSPGFDWLLSEINENPEFAREYESVAVLPGAHGSEIAVFKRVEVQNE